MAPLLRFAPSPTGPLHLGGLRMALYNYLYSKKYSGKWILRIEDTHVQRIVPGSVDSIRSALDWAGLEYDFGPGKGGPHGSYFQSERLDLYRTYAKKLLDSGSAYRCFCSEDKLAATREHLARAGSNDTYDRACLHLSDEEVMRKVRAGEKFTVRFNMSNIDKRQSDAHDLIFGQLKDAHGSLSTDPILLKSDQFPTYHLANVADDTEMGITHVLRGEEWLTSLPLHLDIYHRLGLKPPEYAHFPILLNKDGSKMSKRNGDVQVVDYIRRGWEPSAVLNWLVLAGWGVDHAPTDPAHPHAPAPESTKVMTLPEMIDQFSLSSFTRRASVLDPTKLEYLSRQHLQTTINDENKLDKLVERLHDRVKEAFPKSQFTSTDYIKHVIKALDGRLVVPADLPKLVPYLFDEPDLKSEEALDILAELVKDANAALVRDAFLEAVLARLTPYIQNKESEPLMGVINDVRKDVNNKHPKSLNSRTAFTILRHALTGLRDGLPLSDILRLLGPQRTLERISLAATPLS